MDKEDQLCLLDTSANYIILIILGITFSLTNINLQKKIIICPEEGDSEKLLSRQLLSNVIILIALIYFYCISDKVAKQLECKDRSANYNFSASSLTLAAGIVRFIDLALRDQCQEN